MPRTPPSRSAQLYGRAVCKARDCARMGDVPGVLQMLSAATRMVKVMSYDTGLTPAELKRQLDEAEAWAAQAD